MVNEIYALYLLGPRQDRKERACADPLPLCRPSYHVVADDSGVVLCGGARWQAHVAHVRVAKVFDGGNRLPAPAVRRVVRAVVGHNCDEPGWSAGYPGCVSSHVRQVAFASYSVFKKE